MGIFGSLAPDLEPGDLDPYIEQLKQGDQLTHQLIPPMGPTGTALPPTFQGGTDPAPFSMAGPSAAAPRLVPALRTPEGAVLTHPDAITHADVATAHNFFPTSRDDSGFVPEGGGPYMDRRTAGEYLSAFHPNIEANLKKSGPAQPWGRLEANDLNRATEAADAGVHTPTTDADAFHAAAAQAKAAHPYGAAVELKSPDDLRNTSMFLSGDKQSGFAIKPDGDLVNVFSSAKGRLPSIMETALNNGATKLDAFDTGLPQMYGKYGFQEVHREPWNDQYAPPDWPAHLGKPDVVYMQHPSPPLSMAGMLHGSSANDDAPEPGSFEPEEDMQGGSSLWTPDTGLVTPAPFSIAPPTVYRGSGKIGTSVGDIAQAAQYLRDPVANRNPGIYKPTQQIIDEAAAKISPEIDRWGDQPMKRLFGVTRDDLYQMGKDRVGNMEPNFLGWNPNARGSQTARVATPQNAQRLVDTLHEFARQHPDAVKGMDAWYVMDPAFQRLVQLVGPEEAISRYNNFNHFTGMSSPMSDVETEINRGTAANMMNNRGTFGMFASHREMGHGGPLNFVKGATAHQNQVKAMLDYINSGQLQLESAKVPAYIAASGVPETGFQTKWPVPDSHFTRAIGVPDVRGGEATAQTNLKMREYQPIAPWYQQHVAGALGIQPTVAQARQWNVYGPQTGVETPLGAPKLEILSRNIMDMAGRLKMNPEDLRDAVLLGQKHAENTSGAPLGWAVG